MQGFPGCLYILCCRVCMMDIGWGKRVGLDLPGRLCRAVLKRTRWGVGWLYVGEACCSGPEDFGPLDGCSTGARSYLPAAPARAHLVAHKAEDVAEARRRAVADYWSRLLYALSVGSRLVVINVNRCRPVGDRGILEPVANSASNAVT